MNARLIKHLLNNSQTDLQISEAEFPKRVIQRARLYFVAAYSVPLAAFIVTFYGIIVLFVDLITAYPEAPSGPRLPLPLAVGIVLMTVSWQVVGQAKRHITSMFDNALADILDRESPSP